MFDFPYTCNIYNDDCKKLIKNIPDQSIDLILTDPPYNIGPYSSGNIKFKNRKDMNNDIADWDQDVIDPLCLVNDFVRILKPTGNIFIFTGSNYFGKWHSVLDPIFDTFQYMCWHKTNPTPSVRKSSFLNSIELIVCCWNKGHTWNFINQREMHNFMETSICMGHERLKHPTQKPVKILQHIINITTNPGDTVLDPFMGVGSSGHAALNLSRNFIGYELEKEYFDMATERLNKLMFKEN